MADTGFVFPGTAVNNRAVFNADIAWLNEDNIKADDAVNATVVLSVVTGISFGLAASNFGFGALIPAGSTIDGIEVKFGDYDESFDQNNLLSHVRLILADGTDGSENKSAAIIVPDTTLRTDQAGGATDLWSETITRADVIDVDWGFFWAISRLSGGTSSIRIDYMQMKIFYTEAAGGAGAHYNRRNIGYMSG